VPEAQYIQVLAGASQNVRAGTMRDGTMGFFTWCFLEVVGDGKLYGERDEYKLAALVNREIQQRMARQRHVAAVRHVCNLGWLRAPARAEDGWVFFNPLATLQGGRMPPDLGELFTGRAKPGGDRG
jgi:hypothetical protein